MSEPRMNEDDALTLYEALQRIREITAREEVFGSEVYEIKLVLDELKDEYQL